MSSQAKLKLLSMLGALLNGLIISIPLLFLKFNLAEFFSLPSVWIFYFALLSFTFFESQASIQTSKVINYSSQARYLPYFFGLCIFSIFILAFIALRSYTPELSFITTLASVLIIIGIGVRLLAIATLGKYFLSHISLSKEHLFFTSGVYAIMRHPSEFGLLSICVGFSLLTNSTAGFFVTLCCLFPLVLLRVNLEDKILYKRFESEYIKYADSTFALWPSNFNELDWRLKTLLKRTI